MRGRHILSPSPSGEGIEGWGRCAHLVKPLRRCTYRPHHEQVRAAPRPEAMSGGHGDLLIPSPEGEGL